MLLPGDQAALRGSRLLPAGSNAVASVVGIRAATLDTVTYSSVPPNTTVTPLTYTFAANSVQAGNQIRFRLYGHISDSIASNIVIKLSVTQLTALVPVFIQPNTQNLDVGFVIEGSVSFSQPGPPGRGVVSNQKTVSFTGGAQDSLIVGAYMSYVQTDASRNTTTIRGGDILSDTTTTPSTGLSLMVTNNDQNTTYLLGGQPIGVSLSITTLSSTMTLQGGWLEVM